jgi:hypothetical protein
MSDRLTTDQWMATDAPLISADGRYAAYLQDDANLVLCYTAKGSGAFVPDAAEPAPPLGVLPAHFAVSASLATGTAGEALARRLLCRAAFALLPPGKRHSASCFLPGSRAKRNRNRNTCTAGPDRRVHAGQLWTGAAMVSMQKLWSSLPGTVRSHIQPSRWAGIHPPTTVAVPPSLERAGECRISALRPWPTFRRAQRCQESRAGGSTWCR